jgi:hypothetical protein
MSLDWQITPPSLRNEDGTARARTTDPFTSQDAASSVSAERTSRLKVWIVAYLDGKILADHELVHAQQVAAHRGECPLVTPQRVRTARKELSEAGVLEPTNVTVVTVSGRAARTWTASL